MNWRDIIYLRFGDDGTLELTVGPLFWVGAAALVVGLFIWTGGFRKLKSLFYVGKVSINFAGHHVELHPNDEVIQIAHCAWVELSTRKAGLAFDPENDVIVEVYNSWYELFGEMRRLASACKVRRRARLDTLDELTIARRRLDPDDDAGFLRHHHASSV